jgi:hypothetical protein
MQALSLAKECYSMKLDLLTNATVVDDAIRFVLEKSKYNLKSSIDNSDSDEGELDEESHHEPREINDRQMTTNQIF